MKDKEFLQWLRDRLISVYDENPNVDFLTKLDSIIREYPEDRETPNRRN